MSIVEYDQCVSLRIAALGLLAQEPGSGYDLLRHFEKSMANVWPATQSQLYGELNKLADAGLIEVSDIGPRGRKEYRITEAGRLEGLRDSIEWGDDDGWFYGRAALEHGLRRNLMEAEWARWVVKAIDA